MSKISVCIPVYNVEKIISRCLESILHQSLTDIEVIVVNDCSPDKSMDIVRGYAKTDNRIRIIEHTKNQGLMMARHTGYMVATGDFITFCDSDDTLADGSLECLYNEAIRTNADIVSGVIQYIPVNGKPFCWKNRLSYGNDKKSVFKSMLHDEFGHNLCSRLFRRALLQDYKYETYEHATNGEDGMLFYQIVDNVSKVVTVDNIVYEYWQNIQSSSQVRLKEQALYSIALLNVTRTRTAGKYIEMKKDVDKKITVVYWTLRSQGYEVQKTFNNVGLNRYCKVLNSLNIFGVTDFLKLQIKLLIYRIRK